jgi:hypothetical protein
MNPSQVRGYPSPSHPGSRTGPPKEGPVRTPVLDAPPSLPRADQGFPLDGTVMADLLPVAVDDEGVRQRVISRKHPSDHDYGVLAYAS